MATRARLNQNMCYYKPLRVNKMGSVSLVSHRGLNSAGASTGWHFGSKMNGAILRKSKIIL